MTTDDTVTSGHPKEPYHPYDPAAEARRRAEWEAGLATARSARAPQESSRWNGV